MTISTGEWNAAVSAIGEARDAVISCHVNPDGDALGSALALYLALAGTGRPAVVSFSEPFQVAPQYRFLPGLERLTPPARVPRDADLFVCFDAGSLDRLGSLVDAFQGAQRTIVVDHHASNTRFGDVNLIDAAAPASAVLCRELLEAGVKQYEVAKAVFETNDIGYLRLAADVLGRVTQVPEASLVWTSVTLADQAAHGVDLDQTEGLIDLVRTDAASDVAAVVKEQPDGSWKVSLRSKGGTNVGRIATALGGGGHAFAAGYTSTLGLHDTVRSIVDALLDHRSAGQVASPTTAR